MYAITIKFEAGERLDKALAKAYPQYSRSYLARLIDSDVVLVNGKPQKSGFKLKENDVVTITVNIENTPEIEEIELPIIYEDNDLMVIDKPSGVISHARGKYWYEPSVASFIRQKTRSQEDSERAGIVHRLDRATSGVMICAKNDVAQKFLQRQFSDRKVEKTYIAKISGKLPEETGLIDMPIERNPKKPSTFRVGVNGKPAQTQFKVLDNDLVELKPLTGRTHQLRVHLKQLGCPIDGDELYDGKPAERLMLHAKSLKVKLPSGEDKLFESKLPKEFNVR